MAVAVAVVIANEAFFGRGWRAAMASPTVRSVLYSALQ